ncbi:MAG: outer membrane protein assembly factor BamD [Deltaproteobacteria bacterium]|nr:outer membrane protein assembly factor BamD [Deltaproteobacteria bacterium]
MSSSKAGRGGFFKLAAITLLLLAPTFGLTGCGKAVNYIKSAFGYGSGETDALEGDQSAALAAKAQERMDADDYAEAATIYQQIKDQYPYSRYALLAELKLGDAYYLNAKYIEAYGAYRSFEELHPTNDAVPYAIYQQGMCHYMRMNGIDRDQTPTLLTIQTLAHLIESYPDNHYSTLAKARIAEAQNNLAGHEFYIGEFYYKRKDYQAAMNRFKGLIEAYPDSGYHQRAFNYIAQYRDLVARGEIKEGNQRGSEYNSPFTISDVTEPRL